MVSLDYKLSPGTTLMLYGMYNNSKNEFDRQSKSYGVIGAGYVGYSFDSRPDNKSDILQTSLSGESKLKFLNIKADYGISYSLGYAGNKDARSWSLTFNNASSTEITISSNGRWIPRKSCPCLRMIRITLDCWLNGLCSN